MKRVTLVALAAVSIFALAVFFWRSPTSSPEVGPYVEDGVIGEAVSVVQRPALDSQSVVYNCQTTNRLTSIIYPESSVFHYVPKAEDLAAWKKLMQNSRAGVYARQCAAYFLLASDFDARTFLSQEVRDRDPRRRFNAAGVLFLFMDQRPTPHDSPNPPRWSVDLALSLLADGLLNQVTDQAIASGRPEGDDIDITRPPAQAFCTMLGWIKEPKAVPVLIDLLERDPKNAAAATALGEIGDPAAVPVLLRTLQKGGYDYSEAGALGKLKAREAVPLLTKELLRPKRDFSGLSLAHDRTLLEALRAIGDKSAIPEINTYLATETNAEKIATARRILAQLELDPLAPNRP